MEKKSIHIKNITVKFGEIFLFISYIIPSIYLIMSADNFLNWLKTGVWEKYSVLMLFKGRVREGGAPPFGVRGHAHRAQPWLKTRFINIGLKAG
jgi:hypothetical protein